MGINRSQYPGVPDDFPIEEVLGSLSGTQPKLSLVKEGGNYYRTGTSPSEVQETLEFCLDLQLQLANYCERKARLGQDPQVLLRHVYKYLLQNDWCHRAQSRWICAQIAKQLEWRLPEELQFAAGGPAPEPEGGL